MAETKSPITIVLTGGPCSGKSTSLCYLEEKLGDLGYKVFVVEETASKLLRTGISPGMFDVEAVEERMLAYQLKEEAFYKKVARMLPGEKTIVICDRGVMDFRAYVPNDIVFGRMLKAHDLDVVDLRDKRYDGVFHLRTVAYGKPGLYRKLWKSNPVRIENTTKKARVQDEKTLQAWNGCPHLRIIDNRDCFDEKLKKLLAHICRVVGIPTPIEVERKFLVRKPDFSNFPAEVQHIDIEQIYLATDGEVEKRIRRRGQRGHWVYYQTEKRTIEPGVRPETERHIDAATYYALMDHRDTAFRSIAKKRTCFTHENQYFELDSFISPSPGRCTIGADECLLEIELTEKNDEVRIPPFLTLIREVTGDKRYTNREIARIRQKGDRP